MIKGIGTDIVRTDRFHKWVGNEQLVLRYLHEDELNTMQKRSSVESLAGRFAAKEAFVKSLGTGFRGIRLRDIRIKSDKLGKPFLELHGLALSRFQALGCNASYVSISHDKDIAVAIVILE